MLCTLHSTWGQAQSSSQHPVNPCSSQFAHPARFLHCQGAGAEGGAVLGSFSDLREEILFFFFFQRRDSSRFLVLFFCFFFSLLGTFFFPDCSFLTRGAVNRKAPPSVPQSWARDPTRAIGAAPPHPLVTGSWMSKDPGRAGQSPLGDGYGWARWTVEGVLICLFSE